MKEAVRHIANELFIRDDIRDHWVKELRQMDDFMRDTSFWGYQGREIIAGEEATSSGR